MTTISSPAKTQALNQDVSALLAKGAIKEVDPLSQPGVFYSNYFLVLKKGGGLCPILDLWGLNKFLKVLPFHMLSTADVLHAVAREEWFMSVDLSLHPLQRLLNGLSQQCLHALSQWRDRYVLPVKRCAHGRYSIPQGDSYN